ncbi:hypothetical protein L596_020498 [Steinernema carpocapsae]|uniref:Mediator of RNA polymerase II transcription subunit 14 n=1 Tax=Steinernema carpocapsae TaxID=34508 RepID=A0A4U5MTQ4_STECR|nr:hypothetical protein L596_020498 [Steinernema carpocapsae]
MDFPPSAAGMISHYAGGGQLPTSLQQPQPMEEDEFSRPGLQPVPANQGAPTIPLNVLLDFAVQQIYHDLTVLSELLPKKMDMDRKISIVQFAHDTRQLFVKILAAVKWLKSAKRFEMCSSIVHFLDSQAALFVNTADTLVELARNELIHARVPCYQIAIASDTLTRRTYDRLPTCIKKNFIPDITLTKGDQAKVLHRLNQVIQQRISQASAKLSPRIKNIRIKNGMVTLEVPGEFRVTLTLLGERADTEWTLLNIKMLVQDFEVGYGSSLVHNTQLNMVHNVLQARMLKSKQPITEVYTLLHHFAMTLQLDLLFCQAQLLLKGPMSAYVAVENYNPNQGYLQIGYWYKRGSNNAKSTSQYRLVISFDPEKTQTGLRVRHHPGGKNLDVPMLDDRTGHLSVEKVLSQTMYIRCLERMLRLRTRLESLKPMRKCKFTGNHVPTLSWPLAADGDDGGLEIPEDECLSVGVNMFSGRVVCSVKGLGPKAEIRELENLLGDNAPMEQVVKCINRIRVLLMIGRYHKSVVGLQVRVVKERANMPILKDLTELSADRIILQFVRDEQHYLIVTFSPNEITGISVQLFLYSKSGKNNIQGVDPQRMCDWYGVKEDETKHEEAMEVDEHEIPAPKVKWSNLHKRMNSVISAIDDRLAFVKVIEELEKRNVVLEPLSCEPVVGGLVLKLKNLKNAITSEGTPDSEFLNNLSQVQLRLDTRNKVYWHLECTLKELTIPAENFVINGQDPSGAHSFVQEVTGPAGAMTSENVANGIVQRFASYAELYRILMTFEKIYDVCFKHSCKVHSYSYNKFAVAYGEHLDQLMVVAYKTRNQNFSLCFGMISGNQNSKPRKALRWNAHTMMSSILNERFRQRKDIIWLVNYLLDTSRPLLAISNFARIRLRSTRPFAQIMGIEQTYPVELENSLIIANEYTIRIIYAQFIVEFKLLAGGQVGIRDCSGKKALLFGLEAFWEKMKGDKKDPNALSRTNTSTRRMSSMPNSPYQPPNSLPPQQIAQSPMMNMNMNMSLSVPPAHGFNSDFYDSTSPRGMHSTTSRPPLPANSPLPASRKGFSVDHKTFEKGLEAPSNTQKSPFAEFLFGMTAVTRLGMCVRAYRQHTTRLGTLQLDIFEFKPAPDAFKISFNAGGGPLMQGKPWVVVAHVFMDQNAFKLKLRLDFHGNNTPPESAVRTAERYFEEGVLRLQNEIAFFALMSACRITAPGAFLDLTKIMQAQMEPDMTLPWRLSLQTVTEPTNPQGQKRYSVGIMPTMSFASFMFVVTIRPTKSGQPPSARYQLQLVYHVQQNVLEMMGVHRDPNLMRLLKEGVEQAKQNGECSIWRAVDNVIRNFTPSTGTAS